MSTMSPYRQDVSTGGCGGVGRLRSARLARSLTTGLGLSVLLPCHSRSPRSYPSYRSSQPHTPINAAPILNLAISAYCTIAILTITSTHSPLLRSLVRNHHSYRNISSITTVNYVQSFILSSHSSFHLVVSCSL